MFGAGFFSRWSLVIVVALWRACTGISVPAGGSVLAYTSARVPGVASRRSSRSEGGQTHAQEVGSGTCEPQEVSRYDGWHVGGRRRAWGGPRNFRLRPRFASGGGRSGGATGARHSHSSGFRAPDSHRRL